MKTTRKIASTLAVAMLAAAPAGSVLGGEYQTGKKDKRHDKQSQQDKQSQRDQRSFDQQRDQRPQQSRTGQQDRQQQSTSDGFLIIGYDLNCDGVTDVHYMISEVEFNRLQQERDRQQAQRNGQKDRAGEQMSQNQEQATVRGTIEDARKVTLEGQREAHNLVKIKMQDGRSAIVNIGPRKSLDTLNLEQGDRVRVTGWRGTLNGRQVLMAQTLEADGQTHQISRPASQSRQSDQQAQSRTGRSDGQVFGTPRGEAEQASSVISNWPAASRNAAKAMMQKYGQPQGVTPTMLVWENNGPWKRTIVSSQPTPHDFPIPHKDVLKQVISYDVPTDKFDDLARFDGSVVANRTRGELSARCDKEGANVLALNLAHQIITGEKTVEEARQAFGETMQSFLEGDQTPKLMQKLQFNVEQVKGHNTDEQTIHPNR